MHGKGMLLKCICPFYQYKLKLSGTLWHVSAHVLTLLLVPHAGPTLAEPGAALLGVAGVEFVHHTLIEQGPARGIATIQAKAGLQHPLCPPLLGMADQLGISRFEAHKGILVAARSVLLAQVPVSSNFPSLLSSSLVLSCSSDVNSLVDRALPSPMQ